MNRAPATLPRSGPGNSVTWLAKPFTDSVSWEENVPAHTRGDDANGTYQSYAWSGLAGSVQYGIDYQYNPDTKKFIANPSPPWSQRPVNPLFSQNMAVASSGRGPTYSASGLIAAGESSRALQSSVASSVGSASIYIVTQENIATPGNPPNYVLKTLVGRANVFIGVRVGGYGDQFDNTVDSYFRSSGFGNLQMHLVIAMEVRTNGQWERDGEDVSLEESQIYGLNFPGYNGVFETDRPLEDYNVGWVNIPIERGWSGNYPGFFSQGPV